MPRNRTRDISPSKRLYIGNLFFDVTEEDLRKAFSRFGTVVDIKLIKDTHGLSKGYVLTWIFRLHAHSGPVLPT